MAEILSAGSGGGGGTSSDEVTALKSDVLAGRTTITHDSGDEIVEGDMVDHGSTDIEVGMNAEVPIPEGHYNGEGKVKGPVITDNGAVSLSVGMNSEVTVPEGYHNGSGKVAGPAITDRGAVTGSVGVGGSYTVPEGYHNGSGKVTGPSLSGNAAAAHVLKNETFYSNSGTKQTGAMTVASLTTFSAAVSNGRNITLTWKNPGNVSGQPFSGVIIRYGTSQPTTTSAGTLIYMGAGSSKTAGANSSVTVKLPNLNTTYYFSAWAYCTCSAGSSYNSQTVLISSSYKTASAKTGAAYWAWITGNTTTPAGYTATIYLIGGGAGGGPGDSTSGVGGGGGGSGYVTTVSSVAGGSSISGISIGGGGGSAAAGGQTKATIAGSAKTANGGSAGIIGTGGGGYRTGGRGGECGKYNAIYASTAGSNGISLNGTYYSSSGGGGGSFFGAGSWGAGGNDLGSNGGSGAGKGGSKDSSNTLTNPTSASSKGSGGGGGWGYRYFSKSDGGSGAAGGIYAYYY